VNRWPYDAGRASEYVGSLLPATDKQISYIEFLSKDSEDELNDIMDSIPGDLDIEDLTKGQASYVISCLLGDIKPKDV